MPHGRPLLFLLAGLLLAGLGLWAVLTLPDGDASPALPPHAEIDEASRRALQDVLRENPEVDE